jgi:hypothetical protein
VDLREIFEADAALADKLGVHVHDDVVLFGVDDAEAALFRQHLEGLPDIAEIDHAAAARRQNICREYLECRIAGLDRLRELSGKFGRRLGMQHDVVGPITGTLSDEVLIARLDGLQGRHAVSPIGEIDECRGAAEERCAPDLFGSGGNERRAVRLDPDMMQVHVRVDAARHDNLPSRVDHALGGAG